MVTDFSDDLPNLERFFLNKPGPLKNLGAELLELHQLRVGQHHTDSVVQVMQPLSDPIFVHSCINLTRELLFQIDHVQHDLTVIVMILGIRLIAALKPDDLGQFAGRHLTTPERHWWPRPP
jgi:hypothetical protein